MQAYRLFNTDCLFRAIEIPVKPGAVHRRADSQQRAVKGRIRTMGQKLSRIK
jgi:hypothetical protein